MGQDLRELFARERKETKYALKQGHENRFMSKLEQEMPKGRNTNRFLWLSIAASALVVFGIGFYLFSMKSDGLDPNLEKETVNTEDGNQDHVTISLGDLSPDLKKIEDFYVANINLQLSDLEFNSDSKELVDGYMARLSELDNEYKRLNVELNEIGPNDNTVSALISNLQLRLQLLQRLKTKLNQLKSSKNEQKPSHIV